jgi:hypothetical protein
VKRRDVVEASLGLIDGSSKALEEFLKDKTDGEHFKTALDFPPKLKRSRLQTKSSNFSTTAQNSMQPNMQTHRHHRQPQSRK